MNNFVKKLQSALIVAIAILSIAGVSYTFAAPTQPPSSGSGVDLPLHVGSAAQVKAGDLTVNGVVTVGSTLNTSTLCLSGSCNSSWPSASVTPSAASGSSTYYFANYNTYNNGYVFNVSGSATLSGSGSLVSVSGTTCPCIWGSNCPSSSNVSVQITNFASRTISYSGTCTYSGSNYYANANFSFSGITI